MKAVPRSLSVWRRKAGYAWQDARSHLGLTNHTFETARGARIIVYHGICQQDHLRFNNIFLLRKTLEEQFGLFKRYFNVLSSDDYFQQRFSSSRLNICLHFDDGYANQLDYVLPLLEKYELPASFFITAIRDAGYDSLWNDFLGLLNRYGPKELIFRSELFRKQPGLFPRYVSSATGYGSAGARQVSADDGQVPSAGGQVSTDDGQVPAVDGQAPSAGGQVSTDDGQVPAVDGQAPSAGGQGLREILMSQGFPPKAALIGEFGHLLPRQENKDYWLQMTTDQIRTLSRSAWVTIGAHGYYHNDLSKIAIADAEKELSDCKRFLETVTGKEIKALAFPYGNYTAELVSAAKRVGFSQLFPLGIHHEDALLRERVIINPYVSVTNQLLNVIRKRYDFWR